MRRILMVASMALCGLAPAAAQQVAGDPWAAMTTRDLSAIHGFIEDSHPGAIDAQNPRFRAWMETGYAQALQAAGAATSIGDYQRTLRGYINGFHDNHMRVRFESGTDQAAWPGFSVRLTDDQTFIVAVSEENAVPVGTEILSCDGETLASRLDRDVLPYLWNPELPHAKRELAANLLIAEPITRRPAQCLARVGAAESTNITLVWRPISGVDAATLRRQTNGLVVPDRGIRIVDGVTFVSLPSMDADTGFTAFFEDLEARRSEIINQPIVVLDVRGNRGGHTDIGYHLLRILYGDTAVDRIADSFDWSNAIRVSAGNAARMRATADFMQSSGAFSQREIDAVRASGDRIDAAAARGEQFLPGGGPGVRPRGRAPRSPFNGQVYLLTDSACASACLDFADVALRLPGVTHVGLPTEADAVYMESRHEFLPSGLTRLTFGIKVVRNRVRANNEWYEPRYLWRDGLMSDEAIAAWLQSLPDGRH